MNSTLLRLSASLRCPNCRSIGLNVVNCKSTWCSCPGCGAEFNRIKGFPFLGKQDLANLITGAAFQSTGDHHRSILQANINYHDQFAADYEQDVSTFEIFQPGGACQQRIESVLTKAAKVSGGTMLDVCCGSGNLLLVGQQLFDSCIGVDVSLEMMAVARKRGLDTMAADATDLPFADNTFDCVTAFSAFHHIHNYEKAAEEMARVLKPGGFFYSDWDPNGHVTHEGWAVNFSVSLIKFIREHRRDNIIPESDLQRAAEFHHHSQDGFNGDRIIRTLTRNGFRKVDLIRHFNPPSLDRSEGSRITQWAFALLKLISFIKPTKRNIAPYVAVLGRK